jgi:hypothetical protein
MMRPMRVRMMSVVLWVVAAGLFVPVAMPAGAANRHSDGCTGINATVGSNYVFVGSGYQRGATYVVTITVPNGSSFAPVAVADASGSWTESWLGSLAGTYTASVSTYRGDKYVGTCGLTVT